MLSLKCDRCYFSLKTDVESNIFCYIKQKKINASIKYAHTVMEAYNITEKNASDQLQNKLKMHEGKHSERCAAKNDLFVPEKPRLKCIGFSYIGPKLFNMVPKNVKNAKTTDYFKNKLKK